MLVVVLTGCKGNNERSTTKLYSLIEKYQNNKDVTICYNDNKATQFTIKVDKYYITDTLVGFLYDLGVGEYTQDDFATNIVKSNPMRNRLYYKLYNDDSEEYIAYPEYGFSDLSFREECKTIVIQDFDYTIRKKDWVLWSFQGEIRNERAKGLE